MAAPLGRALAWAAARAEPRSGSFRGPWRHVSSAAAQKPKWKLFGALCLQRPPVVSQPRSPEENAMSELLSQIEMEKSLYSDHEIRCMAEEKNLQKSKDQYGDNSTDDAGKKIVLAQDLEEMWEQNFQNFSPAPRITDADKENDLTSLNRRLDQNLLLLVKQKVGPQEIWLLPQTEWQDGETLRGTAERALTTLSEHRIEAMFLGNAPCGFYKYKFPKAVQSEGSLGAKVFFFKALLQRSSQPLPRKKVDYAWVSKGELADYLKPDYHSQVSRFLVDL